LLVGSTARGKLGYAILWGLIAQGICAAVAERVLTWRTGEPGSMISLFRWTATAAWFVGLVFLGIALLGGLESRSVAIPLTVERWMVVTLLMTIAAATAVVRDWLTGFGGFRPRPGRTVDLTDPERDPRLTRWMGGALALWALSACFAWTTGGGSATLEALKAASIACSAVGVVSMLPRPALVARRRENRRALRWERLEGMGQAVTLLCAAALLAPGI
jgi:hypothetical protein